MINENFLHFLENLDCEQLLNYLFEKKLIFDLLYCKYCNEEMVLHKQTDTELNVNWRCQNSRCMHYQTTLSIFYSSVFYKRSICVKKYLKVMYYLIKKTKISNIMEFVGVSKKTVLKIKKTIIEHISIFFSGSPIRLEGFKKNVQIDETKLNHNVKSHRGRGPVQPDWALTMVDTSMTPARGYVELIPNRSASTILPIIKKVVRSGSIIQTDEWKAYSSLSSSGKYTHSSISHKYHFVDPLTGVHTQNVESFNNKLKTDIKTQKGVMRDQRSNFLNLFMFIDLFKENSFEKLLEILKI